MPRRSCTHLIVPHFERQMEATGSIVTALHRCFAGPFYLMGILKFFGDSLSFVGPLLLGVLVQFIDDQTEPVLFGYICAAALCLASFIGDLHCYFIFYAISLFYAISFQLFLSGLYYILLNNVLNAAFVLLVLRKNYFRIPWFNYHFSFELAFFN